MRKTITIAFIVAALSAVSAFAASISDTYVVPAAAHATGANGELWLTDVQLFNPNSTAVNVDVTFVNANGTSGAVGTTTTVPPNATMALRDVIGNGGGTGAIILSGSQPFVMTSRAYATTSRGMFGESIIPATEFIDATSRDSFLTGLQSNAAARTNVGFFAAADRSGPMTITVTVLSGTGATLGTRSFTVPAGGMQAVQTALATIVSGAVDAATAKVSITGGRGIATAYASIVDNSTSDSTFIAGSSGVLPPSAAAASLRAHLQ